MLTDRRANCNGQPAPYVCMGRGAVVVVVFKTHTELKKYVIL